jgi:hypothetical protein
MASFPLTAPPLEKYVAQGSLSSLAAFRPRRGLGGAAKRDSKYHVCRPVRAGPLEKLPAIKIGGPERGRCATSTDLPWVRREGKPEK